MFDGLSQNILRELCENARISNTEIGKRVGLSAPAVAERIRKMEEQGIIEGYHASLNLDKIGLPMQAYIMFKSTGIKHPDMKRLFDSLPEIIEYNAITGNVCAMLKVALPTAKDLEILLEKMSEHGETSTSVILSGREKRQVLR